jgi:hypothetical protein
MIHYKTLIKHHYINHKLVILFYLLYDKSTNLSRPLFNRL